MAFTKLHDWNPDPAADGPAPAESTRCVGLLEVRLSNADGEWYGYESGATLLACVRVTNSAAKQNDIDARQVEILNTSGDIASNRTTVDAIRAKLDNADPLTDADRDIIANLVLGRLPL